MDGGVGQPALLQDLGVALGGVLHGDDDFLGAHQQIHGAAHTGHLLAGDNPVGQGALLVYLQAAQNGGVYMAAADKAEGGGGVDVAAEGSGLGGLSAGVGLIAGVGLLGRGLGSGADDAVLRLENHMHPLRQVGGYQGGQADAQVDHVAVLQLLGDALGNKALDLRLFHYAFPPSTM